MTYDGSLDLDSIFIEPPRPPSPEPTFSTYVRGNPFGASDIAHFEESTKNAPIPDWSSITIRLVGSHPLWGHYLWNAAKAFAKYLDENPSLYISRNVLELGAGGGLPGIVTAMNGARKVVLTDYPDQALLDNLEENVARNVSAQRHQQHVSVVGYVWGTAVSRLLDAASEPNSSTTLFDLIILSDLIFNHSQHDALLATCELTLRDASDDGAVQPCVLVFYSHHRPHLAHRDMQFFSKATARGWQCVKIVTERYPPMFPEDPGDEEIRATVHGWKLTRSSKQL